MDRMSEDDISYLGADGETPSSLGLLGPLDAVLNPLGSVIGGVSNIFAAKATAKGAKDVAKLAVKTEAEKTAQMNQIVTGAIIVAGIGIIGVALLAVARKGKK